MYFRGYRVGGDVEGPGQRDREAVGFEQHVYPEEGAFTRRYIASFCSRPTSAQASLCALRVIRKVPDLSDHFIAKAKNLLADRNHGVLLTAITLVTEMCQTDAACLEEFRNVITYRLLSCRKL